MRFVVADGERWSVSESPRASRAGRFATGLQAIDALLPGSALPRGAVHDLAAAEPPGELAPLLPTPFPWAFAALLARAAAEGNSTRQVAIFDLDRRCNPMALASMGIPLDRLLMVRPDDRRDLLWAMSECLRSRSIAAVIGPAPDRLGRAEARRLQLAAEAGASVALLMRAPSAGRGNVCLASTRWRISPTRGDRLVRRWTVELLHGGTHPRPPAVHLEYHLDAAHFVARRAEPIASPEHLRLRTG